MKEKWLKNIHDRLTDFDIEEPAGLWDKIETDLAAAPVVNGDKQRSKKSLWLKRAASAAAIIIAIFATTLWLSIDDNTLQPQSETFSQISSLNAVESATVPDSVNVKTLTPTPSAPTIAPIKTNLIADRRTALDSDNSEATATQSVINNISGNQTAAKHEEAKQPNDSHDVARGSSMAQDIVSGNDPNHDTPANYRRRDTQSLYSKLKSKNHGFYLSAHTSGGFGQSLINSSGTGSIVNATGPDNSKWTDSPILGLLLFNQGKEIETDIKHRLPIQTGLSVDYRVNDRISIGSGITYSILTSDIKYGSESNYMSGKQTLHYIGVPLNVRYKVFNWRKLDLYAISGILAEKCVAGKTSRNFTLDNKKSLSESETTIEKRLQWSVNTSAGIQFNASSVVGLYVEPGISYHFDNKSQIENIYKDKPLNFKLNVGLRFTIK